MLNSSIYSSPNTQKYIITIIIMSIVYETSIRVLQRAQDLFEQKTISIIERFEWGIELNQLQSSKYLLKQLQQTKNILKVQNKMEEMLRNDLIMRKTNSQNFFKNSLKKVFNIRTFESKKKVKINCLELFGIDDNVYIEHLKFTKIMKNRLKIMIEQRRII